ncbi:MAG: hypothetical protein ACD_39C00142G0002 [uncultured bacterium]|nr:MAG: hypothetical protein ACD_39C00142G0002 [uncultured bacterium]
MRIPSKILKTTVMMMLLVIISTAIAAQSPFSETPVEVKKISESTLSVDNVSQAGSADKNDSEDKGNIFQRVGRFIKNSFNKLVSAIKNRNKPGKLPAYINRAVTIPGHETAEFVFQGICPMPESINAAARKEAFYRYILLSYYPKTDITSQPSQLIVIDSLTGKAIRRFALYLAAGKPYTGHAGGITAAGKYLWVASGFKLYGFELQQIIDFVADKGAKTTTVSLDGLPPSFTLPARDLIVKSVYSVDSTASYVSFDGEYLWVGDFVKSSDSKYGPVPHHAKNKLDLKTWIAGYRVDREGMPVASEKYTFPCDDKSYEGHKPDRLIFCRESVQGFAISKGFTALSVSYGACSSKLAFYKAPVAKNSFKHSFKPEGQSKTFSADAWVVDSATHLTTIELPAGSEDLEFDGHVLYVGFEGASPNYAPKWTKLNPLLKIESRFYLINPKLIEELTR